MTSPASTRTRYQEMTGTEMLQQLFPEGTWLMHDDDEAAHVSRTFHVNPKHFSRRLILESPDRFLSRLWEAGVIATRHVLNNNLRIEEDSLNRNLAGMRESAEYADGGQPQNLRDYLDSLLRDIHERHKIIDCSDWQAQMKARKKRMEEAEQAR